MRPSAMPATMDAVTYETHGLASGLEQFAAVARSEHITAAATELDVPQPTLSRSLARLQASLGVDLLARDGRGVRLTRQGRMLAASAERALRELRAGLAEVRGDASAGEGRAILGFLHSMGPVAVPTLLRGFRAEHPGIRISLVQGASADVTDDVASGRIDLALASPVPRNAALRSRVLARQRVVMLLPEDHPLAARPQLRLRDLAAEPLISMRPGYGLRTIAERLLTSAGLPLAFAFESDEMSTAAGLVSAGLGVALLIAGNAVPGTVERPIASPGATRSISLVWSAGRTLTPPVRALREHLVEHGPAALR
jgi:DNA-binding transcriptional LysR family regulator